MVKRKGFPNMRDWRNVEAPRYGRSAEAPSPALIRQTAKFKCTVCKGWGVRHGCKACGKRADYSYMADYAGFYDTARKDLIGKKSKKVKWFG